jgi:hypothetical protein
MSAILNVGGESASSNEATATPTGFAAQAYLKAPNAEAGDYLGYSVADTVVVGANYESSSQTTITNSPPSAGAVYIFVMP